MHTPSLCGNPVGESDQERKELDVKLQRDYMFAIGSLNYLVKLSRPDLANAVRDLSKAMKQDTFLFEKVSPCFDVFR